VSEIRGEKQFIRRTCLRLLKLIVANSRAAIANVQNMGIPAGRLRFLPNVVDTDEFCPRLPAQSQSPVHVVAAGRLVHQKRFDRLLSILHFVRRRTNERWTASIFGEGPLKASLEARIRDLGLQDIVKLAGASASMPDVYRSADVLVLTSDHEGTPNVVLEAMATGVPVVSTCVGGVADIIEDGRTGFLLSADDEAGFALNLSSLISSYELRRQIGQSARVYIEHHHSTAKLPEYLYTVYSACA
jgi:glycosyltransferase involved in cell wall biosynthesis